MFHVIQWNPYEISNLSKAFHYIYLLIFSSLCSINAWRLRKVLVLFCQQIVKKLLCAGADVNVQDEEEKLPFHLATELVIFRLLLRRNKCALFGLTPMPLSRPLTHVTSCCVLGVETWNAWNCCWRQTANLSTVWSTGCGHRYIMLFLRVTWK